PTIVRTFIESHPLKGKTVIPFATSGSSGIENSVAQLKKDYPEIQWRDGRLLNGATEQTILEWVEKELKK
uniref:flavodoxin n=1 Tax=Prevotella heparinolytica TaxID=28113 RepID=UPI0035A0EA0B